jgi:hypothetical protein
MPQELDDWHVRAGGYVPRPSFDAYAEKYSRYFAMRRRDGIIELRMHTDGGPARFGFAVHNAWAQAWQEVGNDPDNEVLIITGTGDQWLGTPETIAADPAEAAKGLTQHPQPRDFVYEHGFYDATKLLENFVFGIDIPTIAAINGPSAAHTEFALLCDITLAAETATAWSRTSASASPTRCSASRLTSSSASRRRPASGRRARARMDHAVPRDPVRPPDYPGRCRW